MADMDTETTGDKLRTIADRIEKIAFSFPPPDGRTPELIMLANSIRHDTLTAAPVDHARAEREVIEAAKRFYREGVILRPGGSTIVEREDGTDAYCQLCDAVDTISRLTGKPANLLARNAELTEALGDAVRRLAIARDRVRLGQIDGLYDLLGAWHSAAFTRLAGTGDDVLADLRKGRDPVLLFSETSVSVSVRSREDGEAFIAALTRLAPPTEGK